MSVFALGKDSEMLNDRPQQLFQISHYQGLPLAPIGIHLDWLPDLVKFNLHFELRGVRPITTTLIECYPSGITVNPTPEAIEHYRQNQTKFQLISVVINCAMFEAMEDGSHLGTPYSICLLPATKRGIVDERGVDAVTIFDLDDLPGNKFVYAGFDPFDGTWEVIGDYGLLSQNRDAFSDGIGLIAGQFFLATDADLDDLVLPSPFASELDLFARYHKFRAKKYYTPFTDQRARQIWGCESPIELYFFQALLHRGLHPLPQVIILRDGSIYPSYHHMYEEKVLPPHGSEIASTPDFYFPDERVAVYCDSGMHHRGEKARVKDEQVSDRVRALGIKPVRVRGPDIVRNLDAAVEVVLSQLR